jgi:hypothetical protein
VGHSIAIFAYIARNGYTDFNQITHDYSLKPGSDFGKVKTAENVPTAFRIPVRAVPAARELRAIEEGRQDPSWFFFE